MKTINTVNAAVIANAAAESGIRANEAYKAYIVSVEGSLAEITIETEWNTVTCYADVETGEVLGIMAEAKSSDELIAEFREAASFRAATVRRAGFNKAA
jgi:pyruvate/2-oxoglutarate dehydrogenase complex dihydrolipoamide dehydrogenase (E3) component